MGKKLLLLVNEYMSEEMPQGKQTVSDTQIIQVMREDDDPFHAAPEVAEIFDHSRQWAHDRLASLHEDGLVERKESGERSVIWWPAD